MDLIQADGLFGALLESGGGLVAEWYLRSSLLLAAAWLAHWALLRARPAWRVVLWRVVCVAFVALPLATLLLPSLAVPILPAEDPLVIAPRYTPVPYPRV